MDLSFSFQPLQQQKLSLTPNMLYSLQILRAPLYELQSVLLPIVYENPLLDMEEGVPEPGEPTDISLDHAEPAPVEFAYSEFEPYTRRTEASEPLPEYLELSKQEQTFQELLEEQLLGLPLDDQMQILCRYIIQCLNRRGYLDVPTETLAQELRLDNFTVAQALFAVQMLQPAGVGARSLSECLMLQLAQTTHFCKETVKLISEGLPLLARNDKKAIAALLGCDFATAEQTCAIVRGLNPSPASGYGTGEQGGTILPDAYVSTEKNGFSVRMNDRRIPRLSLNNEYQALLRETSDEELCTYLRTNLNNAKSLMQALDNRTRTLERILNVILVRQQDFFAHRGALKPMRMSQVAGELGMHVSTVSRAVQNKYVHGCFGTIAIKELFSGGIEGSDGSVETPDSVCIRIRQCIAAEDAANPLSDEALRIALKGYGIELSRRTVAKYRESMSIPSSRLRKQ